MANSERERFYQEVERIYKQSIQSLPLDFGNDKPVTLTAIFDAKNPDKYDSSDWVNDTLARARTEARSDLRFVESVMKESGSETEGRARVLDEQTRRKAHLPE